MTTRRAWMGSDRRHNDRCHKRWLPRRNRVMEAPGYLDAWSFEQCGACRFWIALRGTLGLDYGACTNPASPFDAQVRFEHDGCEHFAARPDHSFG
jgi:hypothetical protein